MSSGASSKSATSSATNSCCATTSNSPQPLHPKHLVLVSNAVQSAVSKSSFHLDQHPTFSPSSSIYHNNRPTTTSSLHVTSSPAPFPSRPITPCCLSHINDSQTTIKTSSFKSATFSLHPVNGTHQTPASNSNSELPKSRGSIALLPSSLVCSLAMNPAKQLNSNSSGNCCTNINNNNSSISVDQHNQLPVNNSDGVVTEDHIKDNCHSKVHLATSSSSPVLCSDAKLALVEALIASTTPNNPNAQKTLLLSHILSQTNNPLVNHNSDVPDQSPVANKLATNNHFIPNVSSSVIVQGSAEQKLNNSHQSLLTKVDHNSLLCKSDENYAPQVLLCGNNDAVGAGLTSPLNIIDGFHNIHDNDLNQRVILGSGGEQYIQTITPSINGSNLISINDLRAAGILDQHQQADPQQSSLLAVAVNNLLMRRNVQVTPSDMLIGSSPMYEPSAISCTAVSFANTTFFVPSDPSRSFIAASTHVTGGTNTNITTTPSSPSSSQYCSILQGDILASGLQVCYLSTAVTSATTVPHVLCR